MDTSYRGSKEIYVGEGTLRWIHSTEPITLKVEDVYGYFPSEYWSILDALFEYRPDLHDRINKYKKTRRVD